ncbi:hypothetical protein JHD50_05765 [Sulfurimonas sp. MAG313]|nr:hypothetical protein [Sulfurimonas sp. MAG313]MDF1880815.1 hypothetical protein [Sulfurimonas sp. MAG313]
MFLKILVLLPMLFLISACTTGEPEPKSEFDILRENMQRGQSSTFGNSVQNLENRKNRHYKKRVISSTDLDRHTKDIEKEKEIQRQRWLKVGINEFEAEDWKALGLSPKHAQHWKKTGLSYNTIGVLIKEDVLPTEAISFMKRKFDKNPKAFSDFSDPLYNFQVSCKNIVESSSTELDKISKKCSEYIELLHLSSVSGYMADEYENNDLSLEYIAKLRQIDNLKLYIDKKIVSASQKSLVQSEIQNFTLLFPLVKNSPTKEEMYFIKKHKLALRNTQRYKSYEYYDFWINKEKNEKKARQAIILRQQVLKKEKTKRLKAEAYRLSALAYNKMVASECGEMVTSAPSTGEKVHIEGEILYLLGKKGSNIFAYVVENSKDNKKYLVRDPNARKKAELHGEISWVAVTVGRVVSVSLDDDGTASYNHYSEEDKEFYPMLKRLSKCAYHTKSLTKN